MKLKQSSKNPPNKQTSWTDGFTGEFYQTFKEKLTPKLLKLLQKILNEGQFPSLFYEASITLILQPDEDNTKKKITAQYS